MRKLCQFKEYLIKRSFIVVLKNSRDQLQKYTKKMGISIKKISIYEKAILS